MAYAPKTPPNEWIEKYKREQWTMPFGSMMNAYGQINQGKGINSVEFLRAVENIYGKAKSLIDRSLQKSLSNADFTGDVQQSLIEDEMTNDHIQRNPMSEM